jgi:drug/metabolite transporter (DMT)-like permease
VVVVIGGVRRAAERPLEETDRMSIDTADALAPSRAGAAAGRTDWLGLAAALVTVLLWASAFVGIRAAAADFSPGALAFGRLLVASVVLGLLVAARRPALPRGRDLGLVVAAGVLWFGAYNVTLNAAEQLVDAGTAALLVSVGPLLIVVLAGIFLGEGFPPRLVAGSIVAFAGALVIGVASAGAGVGEGAALGVVLSLLAAVAYAGGVTLEKPVVGRIAAVAVTWLACVVGTLVTAPFAPQLVGEFGRAEASSIAWMVYLGVFPTSVAFTTWAFALGRTSAGRLGSTTYLVGPVAVVLGWAVLGEVPPALAIAGGLVSIAGVMFARSRGRRL